MRSSKKDKNTKDGIKAFLVRARALRKETAKHPITEEEFDRAKRAGRC